MKFKEHIEKILNYKFKKRDDYYEDENNKTVKITIDDKSQGNEITFDILSDISRLLGTRLINLAGSNKIFHIQNIHLIIHMDAKSLVMM